MDIYSTQYRDEQEAAAKVEAEKAKADKSSGWKKGIGYDGGITYNGERVVDKARRAVGEAVYGTVGEGLARVSEASRPIHRAIGRGIGKISEKAGKAYSDHMDTGIDVVADHFRGNCTAGGTPTERGERNARNR